MAAENSQKLLLSTQKLVFLQGSKVIWVRSFSLALQRPFTAEWSS